MRACLLVLAFALLAATASAQTAHFERSVDVATQDLRIRALRPGGAYSLLVAVDSPRAFSADARLLVRLEQNGRALVEKTLHLGDPDVYATFGAAAGTAVLKLSLEGALRQPARLRVQVNAWPAGDAIEREPNNRWEDANPIRLGATVFASADDAPYIPVPGSKPALLDTGADWYRFEFNDKPKLVYFQIELTDRDNIPVDVSIYRLAGGRAVQYTEGEDPVTLPHEVQALSGNKFTARLINSPGAYFVRVAANHPEYKLRTRVYDPPPYSDPRLAIRPALDYMLGAGDSWHANTPRRGGVFDRVASVHQETSLCVACHPTHFSQRAQLYAARKGYPIVQRQQLQFLAERFYNNPRPLYGFEDSAVWARVISAPANVLGRMSHLIDLFEREVTGERRESFHAGVREYLKLYYNGVTKLPADETNGNQPLVSAYEVAWYAWELTRDPAIAALITQDAIKNQVDLCYQTLALAAIDRDAHAEKLRRNADRILATQRPSGQWSMKFEDGEKEVEFQTGHALWALEAAGVPADHPQVKKAIDYLLQRQQPFGGWLDPLQSFENFRTPFRETQMAVLAFSSYFPQAARSKGWNAPVVTRIPDGPMERLAQLDQVWDAPPAAVLRAIESSAASRDVMLRQQAVETLGRLAPLSALPVLIARLGDPSKLVQRTAAWAVRQIYSRHQVAPAALLGALRSQEDRTRWGATRVFATHFAGLAREPEYADALIAATTAAAETVRVQAWKGLWQFWYWTPLDAVKDRIEDAFLAAGSDEHPWVARNVREGIYNLADENIRYLYNNWVPVLANVADRERVIRGRLAIEARLAGKFAEALERGPDARRKSLLTALTEFPLRRADIYDPKADLAVPGPPVYNRIGNDIEQTVFFGESNSRLALALAPLADSSDPEMRRLAMEAALLTRDARFAGVTAIAGPPGPARDKLVEVAARRPDVTENLEVLKAFGRGPRPAAGAKRLATAGRARPDESYFRGYVQPLLETRGRDGSACVQCHATHTLFDGTYGTAMKVVDIENPENSLILRKPTSSAENEGTLGALSHGGGVRWEKDSPEYNTILNWIRGAKP